MKKLALAVLLLAGSMNYSIAQNDAASKNEKLTDQYLGVQLNDLIRQVFNFNNNTTSFNNNPYLLVYSVNSRKNGWGARIGVGYNYNSSSSSDGITSTDTKINDLHLRIGVEKLIKLADKWSAGAGFDLVYNNNDDHTVATVGGSSTGGFPVVTDTKTTIQSYGGGPAAFLRYHITDRIQVGTEASFYYVTGHQNQAITVSDPNNFGSNPTPPTNADNTVGQGTFSSPVVFFLTVKF